MPRQGLGSRGTLLAQPVVQGRLSKEEDGGSLIVRLINDFFCSCLTTTSDIARMPPPFNNQKEKV